jgi:hypothetical protein
VSRTLRETALLCLVAAAALAWTGCGFGSGSPDPRQAYNQCLRQHTGSTAVETCAPMLPQADPIRRRVAIERLNRYAACMRQHGVNMPDPSPQGGAVGVVLPPGVDPNSPEFRAATQACKGLDPLASPL